MGRYYRLIAAATLLLAPVGLQSAEPEQDYFEPGIELPEDAGRDLILRACTRCHTLEGVPAYRKYWGFRHWLPMVETMIDHGAKLDDEEKIIVSRYLAKYYGTDQ